MFELHLEQSASFRNIVELLKDFVREVSIYCDSTGISIQTKDNANVAFCHFFLPKESCKKYRCDSSRVLSFSCIILWKIFRVSDPLCPLIIKHADNGDTVLFIFKTENEDKVTEYELNLMEIQSDLVTIPEIDVYGDIKISLIEFSKIVRDFSVLGDVFTISINKNEAMFSTVGDGASGKVVLRRNPSTIDDPNNAIIINSFTNVTAHYAMKYMLQFIKSSSFAPSAILKILQEKLFSLECTFLHGGFLRLYVASRLIEGEMEHETEHEME